MKEEKCAKCGSYATTVTFMGTGETKKICRCSCTTIKVMPIPKRE